MDGRTGLDYLAVESVIRRKAERGRRLPPQEHLRLWEEIETLETGALRAWNDERMKKQGKP